MPRAVLCTLLLGLAGCADAPPCRIAAGAVDEARLNGICLVVVDERVLAVRHRASGKYDLPGGRRRPEETAQCTAHRETWEETGLDVTVGRRLATFSNAALYGCRLDVEIGNEPPPGTPHTFEVTGVEWVEPALLERGSWRFEDRFDAIAAATAE